MNRTRWRVTAWMALIAGLAVFCSQPASGANVMFTISDVTDIITVSDDNHTGRLCVGTCGFPFPTPCTGLEGTASPCFFTIFFPSGTNSFALTMGGVSTTAVNLLDSFSPQMISDTLQQVDQTASSTLWEFFSDGETPLPIAVPGPFLAETGGIQPTIVITYFGASGGVIGTDTLNIQSDAPEGAPGVPEPGTAVMGLSGLIIVGVWLRRASRS